MFCPTLSLQKRLERRLRGFRTPAYRILRSAIRSICPTAYKTRRSGSPPLRSLYDSEWAMFLPPLTRKRWNPCSIRIPSKNKRCIEKPNSKEPFHYIQQSNQAPSIPQIARQYFHTGPAHPIATKRSIAHPPFSLPLEASRYSPPATEQWNHCIYTYNKQTTKPLPATSLNAKKLLSAYFNMIPRGFNDVLGKVGQLPPSNPYFSNFGNTNLNSAKFTDRKYLRRSCFRAFISDRATGMQPVKAELMGKVCGALQLTELSASLKCSFG